MKRHTHPEKFRERITVAANEKHRCASAKAHMSAGSPAKAQIGCVFHGVTFPGVLQLTVFGDMINADQPTLRAGHQQEAAIRRDGKAPGKPIFMGHQLSQRQRARSLFAVVLAAACPLNEEERP